MNKYSVLIRVKKDSSLSPDYIACGLEYLSNTNFFDFEYNMFLNMNDIKEICFKIDKKIIKLKYYADIKKIGFGFEKFKPLKNDIFITRYSGKIQIEKI